MDAFGLYTYIYIYIHRFVLMLFLLVHVFQIISSMENQEETQGWAKVRLHASFLLLFVVCFGVISGVIGCVRLGHLFG